MTIHSSARSRTLTAAALVALAGATAAPHAHADTGTLTLTNGTFAPTDWTTTYAGTGIVTGSQLASGGNPGTAWNVLNDLVGSGTISGFHLWTGLGGTIDPSATGPISSVALALDGKYISGIGGNGMQISLAIEQDGIIYRTATQALGSTGSWVTRTFSAGSSDFSRVDGLAGTPDFSATGSPITLGFRTANTGGGYNVRAYYDNFLATITADAPSGPVALSGNDSPVPEELFSSFTYPGIAIGSAGHIAFLAETVPDVGSSARKDALCVGTPISQSVVARENSPAPGAPSGVTFKNVVVFTTPPVVNAHGQAFFFSELKGPGVGTSSDGTLYFFDGATTTMVARQGTPAAGVTGGATYGDFFARPLFLNDAGQVAFGNQLNATSNGSVIYYGRPDALSILARAGDAVPELGPGATILFMDHAHLALSNSGEVAFVATESDSNQSFLGSGTPGDVHVIAKEGAALAGLPLGSFASSLSPHLNSSGDFAFAAPLGGVGLTNLNDSAIFFGRPGSWSVVAREGDAAPGTSPGTVFGEFEITDNTTNPSESDSGGLDMAESGAVAFRTSLLGPGVTTSDDSAIYSNAHGPLALVAREGDWAPGTPAGVAFADFFDPFDDKVTNPTINANARVVFRAALVGPDIEAGLNDQGIWATNSAGQLGLLLRRGDMFDVDPSPDTTDLRVVSSFQVLNGGAGGSGHAEVSNDRGQTAAIISFHGGSSGVFILTDARVPADINGDTVTDVLDFLDFINSFGECVGQPAPCGTPDGDVNGDTVVDVLDFLDFLDLFGLMTE